MSRRKSTDVDHVFGGIRFLCPDGHPLGMAVKQAGRYMLEAGLVRVDGPNGETKIKARCKKCDRAGVHRDLQAAWDAKISPLLDKLEADRTASVLDVTIG